MPRRTKKQASRGAAGQSTERKTSSPDRLGPYAAKRHFKVTPEPEPGSSQNPAAGEKKTRAPPHSARAAPTTSSGGAARTDAEAAKPYSAGASAPTASKLRFAVQKHDARRLHYDVRLEIDGAMVSWAVPKGPSYDPAVRRLAVQTEDHPMAYADFEGRIPEGEYGAGDVLLWDRGTYETVPPERQGAMLEKGHLHVRLYGAKLAGDWHLIRTRGGAGGDDGSGRSGKAQWLMFKARDALADAGYDVVADRPESVASGRVATRGPRREGASEKGRNAKSLLEAVGAPALASAASSVVDPAAWLFEIKYDGYRILAAKAGAGVRLATRHENDWTARFPPIADAVARLKARECVIDGEACVVDDRGRPSFARLQEWLSGRIRDARIAYAAFDLLWLDGRDLRGDPIEARRELLERLLDEPRGALTFSRSVQGNVPDLLRAARTAGAEGLVAKRKGSTYPSGRSNAWIKLRFERRQDCAIAGYVPMKGASGAVGALLLAVSDGRALTFAGRVGTGFDAAARRDLARRLERARVEHARIEGAPRVKDAHWVEVTLVCECRFFEWTRDGSMRQPTFLAIREDKRPLECVREGDAIDAETAARKTAYDRAAGEDRRTAARRTAADRAAADRPAGSEFDPPSAPPTPVGIGPSLVAGPRLVNPQKVLFPRDGYTKRDIWDYYAGAAPFMLPHLLGRPLTLQRYPDGIDGPEWYQQNAPDGAPDFVRLVDVGPRHDGKKRIVCDNVETLQWLANLAALTLHQWPSHVPRDAIDRGAIDRAMARPDYVVLDLDPGAGPWSHLVEVGRAVRKLFDALRLESFVKTSGKRGVHVVVPIAAGATHAQATAFAEQVARAVSKVLPEIATVERMKDKRRGKLYVDYGQNGEGRTIVAPYTIRARDGAIVSTPIDWDELDEKLDPTRFTIRTVLARVEKRGDLFAGVLATAQALPTR